MLLLLEGMGMGGVGMEYCCGVEGVELSEGEESVSPGAGTGATLRQIWLAEVAGVNVCELAADGCDVECCEIASAK